MAHQLVWTKKIVEEFEEKAMLSETECTIIETRVRGFTVTQQAMMLNKSTSSIHFMISVLKRKYDAVQMEYPDIFPRRLASKTEDFLDKN